VTPAQDATRQKKFRAALEEGNRRYGKMLKKLA
jgi:death-on-curing protein